MKNKFALWSFIFAMLEVLLVLFAILVGILKLNMSTISSQVAIFLFVLFPVLALVFGIIGIVKSKKQKGFAFALIGTIIGGLAILIYIIFIILKDPFNPIIGYKFV